jgi:hypothetical protein
MSFLTLRGLVTGYLVVYSLHSLQPPWMKPRNFEANQRTRKTANERASAPPVVFPLRITFVFSHNRDQALLH